MKFERDKWYMDREKRKRLVVCLDSPSDRRMISVGKDGTLCAHNSDGSIFDGMRSTYDLIAEWREPVKGEGRFWCNDLGQPVWPVGCQLPDRLRGSVLLRDVLLRYEEIPK